MKMLKLLSIVASAVLILTMTEACVSVSSRFSRQEQIKKARGVLDTVVVEALHRGVPLSTSDISYKGESTTLMYQDLYPRFDADSQLQPLVRVMIVVPNNEEGIKAWEASILENIALREKEEENRRAIAAQKAEEARLKKAKEAQAALAAAEAARLEAEAKAKARQEEIARQEEERKARQEEARLAAEAKEKARQEEIARQEEERKAQQEATERQKAEVEKARANEKAMEEARYAEVRKVLDGVVLEGIKAGWPVVKKDLDLRGQGGVYGSYISIEELYPNEDVDPRIKELLHGGISAPKDVEAIAKWKAGIENKIADFIKSEKESQERKIAEQKRKDEQELKEANRKAELARRRKVYDELAAIEKEMLEYLTWLVNKNGQIKFVVRVVNEDLDKKLSDNGCDHQYNEVVVNRHDKTTIKDKYANDFSDLWRERDYLGHDAASFDADCEVLKRVFTKRRDAFKAEKERLETVRAQFAEDIAKKHREIGWAGAPLEFRKGVSLGQSVAANEYPLQDDQKREYEILCGGVEPDDCSLLYSGKVLFSNMAVDKVFVDFEGAVIKYKKLLPEEAEEKRTRKLVAYNQFAMGSDGGEYQHLQEELISEKLGHTDRQEVEAALFGGRINEEMSQKKQAEIVARLEELKAKHPEAQEFKTTVTLTYGGYEIKLNSWNRNVGAGGICINNFAEGDAASPKEVLGNITVTDLIAKKILEDNLRAFKKQKESEKISRSAEKRKSDTQKSLDF